MENRINVIADEGKELPRAELSHLVDIELDAFDLWFVSTFDGVSSLAKFERSILKTYLMWKLGKS